MSRSPIELIKERLSILDVIGAYVELKHAGKSYKAKSPFTNEKTPSFYVSPDRGMYYCFSSQKGGDIFTFIQEMEGVDFKGALKILADRANVELVAEDPEKRDVRETQYAILEEATQYFSQERERYTPAKEYIEGRGVKPETVCTWRIGYAKDEWRTLKTHLTQKGFTDEQMLGAGLIKRADRGKEPYDVFRDRIIFPIMDSSGRVVAFSGRTMKSEKDIPKYVNSPETELFQKSEILYGYDKAKQGIRQYDFSLVVEGQFDLVLSHQAGYTNTVAVSGTALTKQHIILLSRLSSKVVLALDSDRAGIAAVKRSSIPMLETGMDVKIAQLPQGLDPADVVRRDPLELKKIVGKSVHVIEFLLKTLKNNCKDDRTYKLRVREEIIPLLVAIDNRIDREHFEKLIAEDIGSTTEGVHFEVKRIDEAKKASPHQVVKNDEVDMNLSGKIISRKESLENYIRAIHSVCVDDRVWIAQRLEKNLHMILDDEEFSRLMEESVTVRSLPEFFALETRIVQLREKDFLEEISDTLTHYAHIVARERLGLLKNRIREVEAQGTEEDLLATLTQMKSVEQMLKGIVKVEKEVE